MPELLGDTSASKPNLLIRSQDRSRRTIQKAQVIAPARVLNAIHRIHVKLEKDFHTETDKLTRCKIAETIIKASHALYDLCGLTDRAKNGKGPVIDVHTKDLVRKIDSSIAEQFRSMQENDVQDVQDQPTNPAPPQTD